MKNYIDVGLAFKKFFGSTKYSLDFLCENLLGKELCKYNQSLDWDNRPLRKAQLHYAALDARILISLFEKLVDNNGFNVKDYVENFKC